MRMRSRSGWAEWFPPSTLLQLARCHFSLGAIGGLVGLYFPAPHLFNLPVTAWIMSSADLASAALAMGYLSMALMAVSFLATLLGRRRDGTTLGAVPPSTWAFAAASAVAITLVAVTGYEKVLALYNIARSDFESESFSATKPWPPWYFASFGLAHPVLLMSSLGIASRAMEVAAGRPSLSPRIESLAIVVIGFGASVILVLAVVQPLLVADLALAVSTVSLVTALALGGLWLAAMLCGRERRLVPALWVAGVLALWIFAPTAYGLGGTHDTALHDTYYVVATQHWAIMIAVWFAWFAGWYGLFTEITGRHYLPWLAALQAVAALAGTALMLVPQILLGIVDARRYADYATAFAALNFYSSVGSYLALSSIVLFLVVLLLARKPSDTGDAGSARS
jgi:heme/copper-type cytochrome/quinol oxidase subunit 1